MKVEIRSLLCVAHQHPCLLWGQLPADYRASLGFKEGTQSLCVTSGSEGKQALFLKDISLTPCLRVQAGPLLTTMSVSLSNLLRSRKGSVIHRILCAADTPLGLHMTCLLIYCKTQERKGYSWVNICFKSTQRDSLRVSLKTHQLETQSPEQQH